MNALTEIGGASYVFDANVEGVKRGVAVMKSSFRSVEKEADRVAKKTAAGMKHLAGSFEVLAGGAMDPKKSVAAWSKATGMMAEDMAKVQAEATRTGKSFHEMTLAMMHFNKEGYAAKRGTGALYNVLKEYDVEAAHMMRLTTTNAERQAILASAMDRAKNSTIKAKIEAAAFGLKLDDASKSAVGFGGAIGSSVKALAGFAVVSAGMGALRSIGSAVKAVADIGDLAQNIGLTTDQLQEFLYAFNQVGISEERASSGLQRFAEKMSEARAGEGELADILKANNIAFTDREGKLRPMVDLVKDYADLIKNAATAEDALNLSVMAFGKEAGRDFIEALRNGSAGLDAMAKSANESGAILSASQIAAADEIEKKYNIVTASIQKMWQSMAVSMAQSGSAFFDTSMKEVDLIRQAFSSIGSFLDGYEGVFPEGEGTSPRGRWADALQKAPVKTLSGDGKSDLSPLPLLAPATILPPKSSGKSVDKNLLADLRLETELLSLNNVERRIREELIKAGVTAQSAEGKLIAQEVRTQEALKSAKTATDDASKKALETKEAAKQKIEAESKAIDQFVEGLDEQVKALQLEIKTYGLSNAVKTRAIALSGLAANSTNEQRDAAIAAADALATLTAEHDQLEEATEAATEAAKTEAEEWQRNLDDQREAFGFLKSSAESTFFSILDGSKSVSEGFKEMASVMIREMLRAAVFGEGAFAGLFGSQESGGFFGQLFSGIFGSAVTGGGGVSLYAKGGVVSGPGTGTSDSIPAIVSGGGMARISKGEHIMPAAETKKYGPILEAMRLGTLPKYAKGGVVGRSFSAPSIPAMRSSQNIEPANMTRSNGQSINYAIDARGADAGAIAKLQMQLTKLANNGHKNAINAFQMERALNGSF